MNALAVNFETKLADDAQEWAIRNDHWLAQAEKRTGYRPKHQRVAEPLILCGHGVRLRIDHGALQIEDGFTHYPQQRRTHRFFKSDVNLPAKIVMLDGSGGLSFEVMAWLASQNTTLIRVDFQGEVISVIGGCGSAHDPDRMRWQIETRADPAARIDFCCDLIIEKVRSTIETLRIAVPASPARALAESVADAAIIRLMRRDVRSIGDILLIEARAARSYFAAWRGLPVRWKGAKGNRVPESWLSAGARRSVRVDGCATNRNATHPLNAMLNYAYGLLHSRVQIEALSAGYDPRLGILHETRPDAQAYVLDMMEIGRPQADAQVLRFVGAHSFSPGDFMVREDGVCRLSPQLARSLCKAVGR